MSWSWLPYNLNWSTFIPSFNPPVSIQRRFISFILKRTLGHLVKPGQLDVEQVDAQLGKGVVEINNVELDVEVRLFRLLRFTS
jgi:autophagy-related protein 2